MSRLIRLPWVAAVGLAISALTSQRPAMAQDPALDAACEALQREHQEAMTASASLLEELYYLDAARALSGCVGSGAARWAQTLTPFRSEEDPESGSVPTAERRLYRVTASGAQLVESEPARAYDRPFWALSAADFDNDGNDELVEFRGGICEPTSSRILTWRDGAVMSYGPAESYEVLEVRDVNADNRPDLLLANPFVAYHQTECEDGSDYAFLMPAIAQTDGSFSTSDPSVRDYVRAQCPAPPTFDDLAGLDASLLGAITCARFWGMSSEPLMEEIDRVAALDPEGYSDVWGFSDAALVQPPFRLDSSGVASARDPAVDAACEALHREHREAMAASPAGLEEQVRATAQFACVGSGGASWAQTFTPFRTEEHPHSDPVYLTERRLYRVTAAGAQLVQSEPVSVTDYSRPIWTLAAVDFDGDGSDELVETRETVGPDLHRCRRDRSRILAWHEGAVMRYGPAESYEVLEVRDVNRDNRPDLLLANPFVAYDSGEGSCIDAHYAFLLPAIAQADGRFSTTDPAVQEYVREQCPTAPSFEGLAGLNADALAAVTCARFWGVGSDAIMEQVRRLDALEPDEYSGFEGFPEAAEVQPPVRLDSSVDDFLNALGLTDPADYLSGGLQGEADPVWTIPAPDDPETSVPFSPPLSAPADLPCWTSVAGTGGPLWSANLDTHPVVVFASPIPSALELSAKAELWQWVETSGCVVTWTLAEMPDLQEIVAGAPALATATGDPPSVARSTTLDLLPALGPETLDLSRAGLVIRDSSGSEVAAFHPDLETRGDMEWQSVDEQASVWVISNPDAPRSRLLVRWTRQQHASDAAGTQTSTILLDPTAETADRMVIFRAESRRVDWTGPDPEDQLGAQAILAARTAIPRNGHHLEETAELRIDVDGRAWLLRSEVSDYSGKEVEPDSVDQGCFEWTWSENHDGATCLVSPYGESLCAEDVENGHDDDVEEECPSDAPAGVGRPGICTALTERGFHLRPQPTAESTGTEFEEARALEILAPGGCTRRGTLIYEVRDVLTGQTGWVFLTDGELDAGCPPFAAERAAATACP